MESKSYNMHRLPNAAGGSSAPGRLICNRLLALVLSSAVVAATRMAAAQENGLSGQSAIRPVQTSSIRGTVLDADGDSIVGARVVLLLNGQMGETVTGTGGEFSIMALTPGAFQITITATGFAPKVIAGTVCEGESYAATPSVLAAAANVDVQVTLSRHDLALAEVTAEEHQRLAGFLPNFFVTYDWHAAPLSSKQKFELAWKTTIDPATLLVAGAVAGVQQARNDFPGYGGGAPGFGKRYGAVLADTATGNFLGGAVLPSLLHQDPRYFYKGTGTVRSRTLYALGQAVICRGDNGHWQPNYSSVLGDLAAGGLSNLYYPASDRNGVGLTLTNGLLGVVGDAIGNVIQEFVFRRITPHLPPSNSPRP